MHPRISTRRFRARGSLLIALLIKIGDELAYRRERGWFATPRIPIVLLVASTLPLLVCLPAACNL